MLKHARRLFVALSAALATALTPVAATTAQAQTPYLQLLPSTQSKYAAIVIDAKSGEVLYGKRADSPRYPASITKVMTLYLTFEALAAGKIDMDDPVMFSPRASEVHWPTRARKFSPLIHSSEVSSTSLA